MANNKPRSGHAQRRHVDRELCLILLQRYADSFIAQTSMRWASSSRSMTQDSSSTVSHCVCAQGLSPDPTIRYPLFRAAVDCATPSEGTWPSVCFALRLTTIHTQGKSGRDATRSRRLRIDIRQMDYRAYPSPKRHDDDLYNAQSSDVCAMYACTRSVSRAR